ncbi:MAG TPA: CPBP family intramembrane metalloprotease [bacterium]|nr:CPBP family intramembrane metalloprotease [bacterium]
MEWRFWKEPGPRRFALELAVIYIVPVTFIKFGLGSRYFFSHFKEFMALFVCWSIGAGIYAWASGLSRKELGFTVERLGRSLFLNFVIMLLAITVVLLLAGDRLLAKPHLPRSYWFPLFYIFLSCPSQEFLYRGLLFPLMERSGIRHGFWLVLISTVAYAFLHIIFHKPFMIPLTFAIGIAWGIIYWRIRNLWGIMLSHATLGLLTILAGLT